MSYLKYESYRQKRDYIHCSATIESLEPLLPLKLQNLTQTDTVYEVKSLASVYTLDARSRATKTYKEQLCDIAKLSGTSLSQMLKEELTHLALSHCPPLLSLIKSLHLSRVHSPNQNHLTRKMYHPLHTLTLWNPLTLQLGNVLTMQFSLIPL